MMVPRAFLFASAPFQTGAIRREKDPISLDTAAIYQPSHESHESSSRSDHVVADATVVIHTNPVIIPPKRSVRRIPGQNVNSGGKLRHGPAQSTSLRRSSSAHTIDREIPASVASLLEVTAIPLRKNSTVRSSRRLPGKYAEDFSRLMSEGTKARDGNATALDGSGQSPLDFLLSPPEEDNEKSRSTNDFGSETPFSIRSMSTDSIPSLDHDLDSFMTSEPATPSLSRRLSERRKQLSPPEECATNHPLLEVDEIESIDSFFPFPEDVPVPSKQTTISFHSFPRLGSTFKSNLTASLRAIKSAAQTVSNFTTPSVQPEDFLTRSLFSINPELTDDRRPLPMSGPPSPALRRYLNPIALSPAEMHVYHESQDLNQSIHNSPVSIQMQTYHPSGSPSRRGRFTTGNASGKDHAVCLFDPELPPSRQREPRENSDFLRMVVLEMNMRRSGKLRDDIPTRAKIWLPPRQPVLSSGDYGDDEPSVPQRWVGASIECS
jgi:hypothetical protein